MATFIFDKLNRLIIVQSPTTTVSCQEILNACRDFEDEFYGIDIYHIAVASGKQDLGGGVSVGITLTLLNWRLQFEARPGPDWIACEVNGGNLLAVDSVGEFINPIAPSAYVSATRTTAASATLQEQAAIEFGSFNGSVTIDVTNGVAGTTFPIGTEQQPVNNLIDAQTIASERGFRDLYIKGNITINEGEDISGYHIHGEDTDSTTITLISGSLTTATRHYDLTLTGVCGGRQDLTNCVLKNIQGFCATGGNTYVKDTILVGNVNINPIAEEEFYFINCVDGSNDNVYPIINCNNAVANIYFRNYSGTLNFINNNKNNDIDVDLISGHVNIDSSVTNGSINIRGIGTLVDNSNGATINNDSLITKALIAEAVSTEVGEEIQYSSFNDGITIDIINGVSGTNYPIGNTKNPVSNLTDAQIIADARGFTNLYIKGNISIANGEDISGYYLHGEGPPNTIVTLLSGSLTTGTRHKDLTLTGVCGGRQELEHCILKDIQGFCATGGNAYVNHSILVGDININPVASEEFHFIDCVDGSNEDTYPKLLCNNSPATVFFRHYSGTLDIYDHTSGSNIDIDLTSGLITLDSTVTSGTIIIRGSGVLIDNSNGAIVDSGGLISKDTIAHSVWNEDTASNTTSGTFGAAVVSSQDLTDITNKVTAIYNKLPAGTIASSGEYTSDINEIKTNLERSLGLMQENYYIDQTNYITYNGVKLMTSGRMRIYSDASSVGTDSNVVATYQITTDWTNDEMTSYKVKKL